MPKFRDGFNRFLIATQFYLASVGLSIGESLNGPTLQVGFMFHVSTMGFYFYLKKKYYPEITLLDDLLKEKLEGAEKILNWQP